MMKKFGLKLAAGLCFAMFTVSVLVGCGGSKSYADGTYTAQSEVHDVAELGLDDEDVDEEANGYGVVTITIKDGVITECTYLTYQTDGNLKDENYGKKGGEVQNKDYFNKAQKAVASCEKYAEQLVETGDIDQVDTISGATINYDEFKEAVKAALKQAEE